MRVLIASSTSPFNGREESAWAQAIADALKKKKVEVDLFTLPFVQDPLLIQEQMTALRLIDLENGCDQLITIGYPAFVLKHSNKRVLLFSLASSLHECFDSEYGVLGTPQYRRIQSAVIGAEKSCLAEARQIICASRALAASIGAKHKLKTRAMLLDDYCGDFANTLLPESDTWVVCESTLEPRDRIDLLLSAVTHSREKWLLNIFVPSCSDVYYAALQQQISQLKLGERVRISRGAFSAEVLRASSVCVALPFASTRIPGGVIRAAKSLVPIITASDCGALLEIVTNEKNGLVVEPSAKKIAQALDMAVVDAALRERLSQAKQNFNGMLSDVYAVTESLTG